MLQTHMHSFMHARPADPPSSGGEAAAFSLDVNQTASDASSRIDPREQTKRISVFASSAETFAPEWSEPDWEEKGTRRLAARSTKSSVFTLDCQQVKVGDNAVWCCQTEFLPPNFTSSSPRPLSRLQSPPYSLLYLSLLTLIHCSRALQFKALRNTPPPQPIHIQKNCNPNFFFNPLLPLLSSNYSSASALTSSRY